jgi:hypothetical protein
MRSSAHSLRLAGAAILLLASAVPAFAADTNVAPADNASADTGAAPAAAKPAAEPVKERKICKTEAQSESRLGGKKICMTAKQWRARQG